MRKKYKVDNRILQELLVELWENASFSEESYKIVKDLAINSGKTGLSSNFPLKDIFFELSTIRNRHLIRSHEQRILKNTVIGVFGMSVGSHVAETWMMESRADVIKIIDLDKLAGSNLNRLKFGWSNVGEKKTDLVKEELLKISPFADIVSFEVGDKVDILRVFNDSPKIKLVVDEIDDVEAKVCLRMIARKNKIPLIQAADVGDNIVLDIERYDKEPQPDFFLGRVPGIEKIDLNKLSQKERTRLIVRIVGFEENSEAMLDSLLEIGESLATWPQLGATAAISGGVVTTAIKKIILGEDVDSGRYYVSLDRILVKNFNSSKNKKYRRDKIRRIKKKLGLN